MTTIPPNGLSVLVLCAGALLFSGPLAAAEEKSAPRPAELDFSGTEEGAEPAGLFVIDGEFVAGLEGDRKVLEMKAEPLVEGLVLVGETLRGGGSIRAKIHASKRGRSYPRFGVGLHGISGYRLRVVPAQKSIEIFKDDESVEKAEHAWKDGAWTWAELSVIVVDEEKARLEGRVWEDGAERPAKPQLAMDVEGGRFTGKAVLSATPYSGTPVRFDRILVSPRKMNDASSAIERKY